jgi:hypothetical protein
MPQAKLSAFIANQTREQNKRFADAAKKRVDGYLKRAEAATSEKEKLRLKRLALQTAAHAEAAITKLEKASKGAVESLRKRGF